MDTKLITVRRASELASYDLNVVVLSPEGSKRLISGRKGAPESLLHFDLEAIRSALQSQRFNGQALSASFPILMKSGKHVVVMGRGDTKKETDFDLIAFHRKLGAAIRDLGARLGVQAVAVSGEGLATNRDTIIALREGIELSQYQFNQYRKLNEESPKPPALKQVAVISDGGQTLTAAWNFGRSLGRASTFAQDLVNTPPCDCPPRRLAAEARAIARRFGMRCDVFDKAKLQRMRAGALLAVAKGSSEPPFLIRLSYTPRQAAGKPLALVGKGVTFDSGGLSIKSAKGMETMKVDMSGAAAVLAAMQLVGEFKPKRKITAYIPTTENMINGMATRPGDVVSGMSGKTIEILNTDAEGRLILSDALTLAVKDGCSPIIDLATLTGACMVALGNEYAGLFSTDDKLAQSLADAGEKAGERLWRMPLAPEYQDLLKSAVADIKNTGGSFGGAITAALFLKTFVGDTPWAHLDIAGPAYLESDRGYKKRGGTGFGVRTLARYLLD